MRVKLTAAQVELKIHQQEGSTREKYRNKNHRNLLDFFLRRASRGTGIRTTDKDDDSK